ncbi:hypothetical protein GCM10017711_13030 [Paeniglutamicibacter sulfureus]
MGDGKVDIGESSLATPAMVSVRPMSGAVDGVCIALGYPLGLGKIRANPENRDNLRESCVWQWDKTS